MQVLGVATTYLYCDDDELAEMILTWGKLPRDGRAQARKAALGLVAGRQGSTVCQGRKPTSTGNEGGARLEHANPRTQLFKYTVPCMLASFSVQKPKPRSMFYADGL